MKQSKQKRIREIMVHPDTSIELTFNRPGTWLEMHNEKLGVLRFRLEEQLVLPKERPPG